MGNHDGAQKQEGIAFKAQRRVSFTERAVLNGKAGSLKEKRYQFLITNGNNDFQ